MQCWLIAFSKKKMCKPCNFAVLDPLNFFNLRGSEMYVSSGLTIKNALKLNGSKEEMLI